MGVAYGGTVDRVQISFIANVVSSKIDLTDPSGNPVSVGETELTSADRIAITEFDALSQAGAYVVRHTEIAGDGDVQTDTYQFFYDPDSSNTVDSLVPGGDGPNWLLLSVIAGVVLVLGGFFWPGRSARA